ncbi:hypothetical protein I203_101922 [Kwoniella mangroviensis CBS 8507]|uniref:uncharacterized protein n=1 Tax=Kwoniella mangroviensis CBS 8507 TaxID=1296122 RepID=UPI00303B23DC
MSPITKLPIMADLDMPTGHSSRYCLDEPLTLNACKKCCSLSGGDYLFKDEDDQVFVKSVGKANIRQDTTLFDANGEEAVELAVKMKTLDWAITGSTPSGEQVFTVKLGGRRRRDSNITTEFTNMKTGQTKFLEYETWKCRGDRKLFLEGEVVASVHKDHWYSKKRQIDIAANMDYTLVMATIIFYDIVMDQWLPAALN